MVLKVLLDTNFLLLPHQHKVDVFDEVERIVPESYDLVTLTPVLRELAHLASQGGEDAVAAKIGLELLGRRNVRVIDAEGSADDAIVKFALENKGNILVCTNDAGLKRRLNAAFVPLIVMRSKSHLVRL